MEGGQKRWTQIQTEKTADYTALRDRLKFDDTLTSLLWNRGIRDFEAARRFFRPSPDQLHNPFLMKDMEKAVSRVLSAIDNGETIMVYGDYDVDGTTAVTTVATFLQFYTDRVITYIPDRYLEGYGLSTAGIQFASDHDCAIVIALDCGIKAFEQADLAVELGIDLIIGDHHTPATELPNAFAILDPKRLDCSYPYDELSGCGIGYKLCSAIQERMGRPQEELYPLLDLVVVSIGADIVPITGENRVLAQMGLERLNTQPRPAFRLIKENARKAVFDITDVVFTIAPRINAAGRIDHADNAVQLMMSTDGYATAAILNKINEFNTQRKELDSSITDEALALLESDKDCEFSSVVKADHWHKGVIGIVASRLMQQYYRPTLVFTESNGVLAGSARSVKDFNIYNALEACSEHLIQFGGHMYAAGMTLQPEKYSDFKSAFEQYVAENIQENQRAEEIIIDGELDIDEIDDQWVRRLMHLHPHGPLNTLPTFSAIPKSISHVQKMGSDKSHIKFKWKGVNCIGFGLADWENQIVAESVEIAFHLEYNEFRNQKTLQVRILDIRALEK